MAKLCLPLTRNASTRAAAHRAMAKAALFADSSARTRLKRYRRHTNKAKALELRAALPSFVVYLARSATRLEIHAPTWQEALRRTGRDDACLVKQTGDREFEVTHDPDAPQIIDYRIRYGSADDALRAVLDHVACQLASEAQAEPNRRAMAAAADGLEPETYLADSGAELSPSARRRLMRAYDVLRLEQRQGGES